MPAISMELIFGATINFGSASGANHPVIPQMQSLVVDGATGGAKFRPSHGVVVKSGYCYRYTFTTSQLHSFAVNIMMFPMQWNREIFTKQKQFICHGNRILDSPSIGIWGGTKNIFLCFCTFVINSPLRLLSTSTHLKMSYVSAVGVKWRVECDPN